MEPIADLLPDVPRPERRFDVSVSVPLAAERDCPVPRGYPRVPAGLLGGWMRDGVTVGGEVRAPGMLEALVVTAAVLGDWLEVPGAELRVQPIG